MPLDPTDKYREKYLILNTLPAIGINNNSKNKEWKDEYEIISRKKSCFGYSNTQYTIKTKINIKPEYVTPFKIRNRLLSNFLNNVFNKIIPTKKHIESRIF